MKIEKIIKDKKKFNKFVLENEGSFLQSFDWGEFYEATSGKVERFFVSDDGEVLLCASVLKNSLPAKKSYLYIPYGPVVKKGVHINRLNEAFLLLINKLKNKKKSENAIFLKIEQENAPFNLESFGFKKSEKDIQAVSTLILDISKSEEEILGQMKQKTRYNIRLAKKKGVKVFFVSEKEAAFDIFYNLLSETAKRNGFNLHPKNYYENMMDMFLKNEAAIPKNSLFSVRSHSDEVGAVLPLAHKKENFLGWLYDDYFQKVFFAEYQGKILACALVGFWGKKATYLHGASSSELRNVMAPYLLHWEIIKKAKELGFSEYDFWGIATKNIDLKKKKQWSGFSRFKEGFGGRVVERQGAYDLPFSKTWYFAYKIARKIK